ncbi:UNVERIFIED_CONTAM: hypothetical protein FKN15_019981 [Acipenser sinensis]
MGRPVLAIRRMHDPAGGGSESPWDPPANHSKDTEVGAPRKPIVDTDVEFDHAPTHGDASKKRLIEDTEDWHPRTGTSQSRSFRILAQITGTERGTLNCYRLGIQKNLC